MKDQIEEIKQRLNRRDESGAGRYALEHHAPQDIAFLLKEVAHQKEKYEFVKNAVQQGGIIAQLEDLREEVERLRACLQNIWDADEMGYLLDGKSHECVQCGNKKSNDDPAPVNHAEECVEGWIEKALAQTPAQSLDEATQKASSGGSGDNET